MKSESDKELKVMLDSIVGRNINIERLARKMSRDEFARLLGMTTSHLGLIERGERGATSVTLMKLKEILGRPIDNLFCDATDLPFHERSDEGSLEAQKKVMVSLATSLTDMETEFIIGVIKGLLSLRLHQTNDRKWGEK